MISGRWAIDAALEEIELDSINIWVQIRGIPPEFLSVQNIKKAARKIGDVLEVKWGDPVIPKWFSTPRVLVKVKVLEPICPGFSLRRKNGTRTWVSFKYEKACHLLL